MASFTFRLESLLRVRRDVEKAKQRQLAEAQQAFADAESALAGIQREMTAANDDVRDGHLTGSISVEYLMAHRRFLAARHVAALQQVQQLARHQAQVNTARAELAAAARDRKALEKLREKRQAEWQQNLDRREQADLDEVSTQIAFDNLQEAACTP